jgi:hypothetical protein
MPKNDENRTPIAAAAVIDRSPTCIEPWTASRAVPEQDDGAGDGAGFVGSQDEWSGRSRAAMGWVCVVVIGISWAGARTRTVR